MARRGEEATQPYSKAAAVLPTVDTNCTRRRGMGGGGAEGTGGPGRPAKDTELFVS